MHKFYSFLAEMHSNEFKTIKTDALEKFLVFTILTKKSSPKSLKIQAHKPHTHA